MEDQVNRQRRAELRHAVIELSARGLYAPAKWAAEQLSGLPDSDSADEQPSTSGSAVEHEDNRFLLARSFFDLKVAMQPCVHFLPVQIAAVHPT